MIGPMSKSLKIILVAFGGFFALLVLVAVALRLFVDANAFKPRVEAAASEAVGMEVKVGGRLGISVFPGLHVTLADVRIRNLGEDIASAKEAGLAIDILPLLRREVRIRKLALKKARIFIERHPDGTLNIERRGAKKAKLPVLDLAEIFLSDGTLVYANKQSGDALEASDCSLDVRRVRLSGGESPDLMKNLSATAELACGKIRRNAFTASDVKLSADGTNGVFDLKPLTMRVFGAEGSGRIQADFSGAFPRYHVHFALPQFHIEEFFKARSPEKVAEGLMDFTADLSMQDKTGQEMTQTAEGQVSLRGENLTFIGRDLDTQFSRFESSQNFNLVDVGAFFFAGPFGLVVTKGYDFASHLSRIGAEQQDPDARLRLEGRRRRGACAGRGHGDEQEPGRSAGRARFRE